MTMTQQDAEVAARFLGQFHDAMAFTTSAFVGDDQRTVADVIKQVKVSNPLSAVVSGFVAVAIIYSYDTVAKPLGKTHDFQTAINRNNLNITTNAQWEKDGKPVENADEACFRHLRNVFAHGRFNVDANLQYHLFDEYKGAQTFKADADVDTLIGLATAILLKAEGLAIQHVQQISSVSPNSAP